MTPDSRSKSPSTALSHELGTLREEWWWFALLGGLMVALGTAAICTPFLTSLVGATIFGFFMLVAGAAQIVSAFWAGKWSGLFLQLVAGILYLVVGALIVSHKGEALEVLTLLLAAFFIVGGLMKIVISMQERFHQWGWVLFSGCVSLLLGILIWRQFPESAFWVIGLFIGIELIFNGWIWVMMGFELKQLGAKKA